jgi:hypothetical protein
MSGRASTILRAEAFCRRRRLPSRLAGPVALDGRKRRGGSIPSAMEGEAALIERNG